MIIRNVIYLVLIGLLIGLLVFFCIFKKFKKVWKAVSIVASSLVLIATIVLSLFPPYSDIAPTGSHVVASLRENYVDESRIETYRNDGSKRELEICTWYPKDIEGSSDKCAWIVFSHGAYGTINNNKTLYVELASRGYIVTSIAHTYQAFETKLSNGKKVNIDSGYFNDVMNDDPHKNPEKSLERFNNWMDIRTKDISFVIDTGKALSLENHQVFSHIDTSKIVTMGHSLGGSAALGMPRLRSDVVAAVALESPFMCDITGVENGKFTFIDNEYPVPVLNIYSDTSYSNLSEWSQYEENYKLLNSNNPKYKNVYMEGKGHMHLCDFSLQSPMLSWWLSGTDSKSTAKDNLTKLNNVVISFLNQFFI